jgi:membrane protease subunit (stomatin/prohibitin family)
MGLFNKLRQEFIDIIEWVDATPDTIVWKFPRYQNEIKNGAQLTVRESQAAVFLDEGKLADVYGPGRHVLTTQNMPILTTLRGWKYAFNSPFKVDIYFVNTRRFIDQKWGTKNPFILNDPRFGFIELRAFGTYSFRVADPGKFIKEIAGTRPDFSTEDVAGQIRSLIVTRFTDAMAESQIPLEKFAMNLDELSQVGLQKLNAGFSDMGLEITAFLVENVSMPDDIKQEIFKYSRLQAIDPQKLAQFNMANAIGDAAKNEGLGGAGVGMGVGFGMGNMMTNMFQQMNSAQQQNTQQGMNTPPPLTSYYVAINNQQSGPFTLQQIQSMIASGQIQRNTLVWKTGMPAWAGADTIAELASLFQNTPPPLS